MEQAFIVAETSWFSIIGILLYAAYQIYSATKGKKKNPVREPTAKQETYTQPSDTFTRRTEAEVKPQLDNLEDILRRLNDGQKAENVVEKKKPISILKESTYESQMTTGYGIFKPVEDEEESIIRENKRRHAQMLREREAEMASYSSPIGIGQTALGRFKEFKTVNPKSSKYKKLLKGKGGLRQAVVLNEILNRRPNV